MTFEDNPCSWLKFIESLKTRVNLKATFNDSVRKVRLLSVLKGEAKCSIESMGRSDLFSATALKSLKRDFGNPFFVSDIKLKLVLDKAQIKSNNCAALRKFQQKLTKLYKFMVIINGLTPPQYRLNMLQMQYKYYETIFIHDFYRHSETLLEVNKTVIFVAV